MGWFELSWVGLGFKSNRLGSIPFRFIRLGSVSVWSRSAQSGSVRFGSARFGSVLVRLDSVRLDSVRFGSVRFGSVRRMIAWMNEKLIEERMLVEYMHGLMDEQRNEQ